MGLGLFWNCGAGLHWIALQISNDSQGLIRYSLSTVISAFFVFLSLASSSASSAPGVDFHHYVHQIIECSPQVDSQRRALRIARDQQTNAHQYYLPHLDLVGTVGKLETSPATPYQPDSSDATLGLKSQLYDGGNNQHLWKQTDISLQKAELEVAKVLDAVSLDASQRFLTYSQALHVADIEDQLYSTLQKQAQIVSAQYHQGLRPRRDDLRFESQVHREMLQMSQAHSNVEKSEHALRELCPNLEMTSFAREDLKSWSAVKSEALPRLEDHRDYKIQQLAQQIRELQFKIDRTSNWPTVSLTAGTSYEAMNFTTPRPNETQSALRGWNVLMSFNWNLIDWGENTRKTNILQEQKMITDNSAQITLEQLRTSLQDLATNLRQSESALKVSQELLQMEENTYADLARDFREGKASYLDLITSLNELMDAKRQHLANLYDHQKYEYEWLANKGELYEKFR